MKTQDSLVVTHTSDSRRDGQFDFVSTVVTLGAIGKNPLAQAYRIRSRCLMIWFRPFSVWVSCSSRARLCCWIIRTLEVMKEGSRVAISGWVTSRRWFSSAEHRCKSVWSCHDGTEVSSVAHHHNRKLAHS